MMLACEPLRWSRFMWACQDRDILNANSVWRCSMNLGLLICIVDCRGSMCAMHKRTISSLADFSNALPEPRRSTLSQLIM